MFHYKPPTLLLRNKDGEITHINKGNAEIVEESFNKLLNCNEHKKFLKINTNTNINTKRKNKNFPTAQEVKLSSKEIKFYKVCGEDQIFVECGSMQSKTIR